MSVPGDLRPGRPTGGVRAQEPDLEPRRVTAWSPTVGLIVALGIGFLSAVAWSILRGILELSVGLLVVSALGGWGIGAALRRGGSSRLLAVLLGTGAWALSLVGTWFVTRLTLLSDRPLAERLVQTPFLDFTAQQFGVLDILSLALFAGAAWIGAGRSSRSA
jgi:hypothetical protein